MNKTLFKRCLSAIVTLVIIIGVLPRNNKVYCASTSVVDDSEKEMYTIPATLYDYKSDSEIANGSIDNYYNGTGQWLGFNHYGFEKFNSKISDYFSSKNMKYPMYFGDFNDKVYSKTGQKLDNFYWAINRATRDGSNNMNAALQGLVDNELEDGKITQNKVELPYFNDDFLTKTTSNKRAIGKVVNTRFPFRKTTSNGIEYYEFDSTNGQDNIWLENDNLKYSSSSSSHSVWDANHVMVSANSKDNIGFFPFNNRSKEGSDNERKKLNFGFGIRMDLKFNIPKGGVIKDSNGKNQDVIFEFTGDDDVWVFIDGKLALDIGGEHKKSVGSINFNSSKLYSKVEKVVNGSLKGNEYQGIKNGSEVKLSSLGLDFSDPTKEHTISLFYMERGMIESNMKIRYNFTKNNMIEVAKEVDNSNVNEGLKEATKSITDEDDFNFSINSFNDSDKEIPISNFPYQYKDSDKTTSEDGKFTLKDKDESYFINAVDQGESFKVKEDENNKYSTKIKIINGQGENEITGKDTGKVYCIGNDSLLASTSVLFTNKIKTGDLIIRKTLDDYVKEKFENYDKDEFTFQVKLKNLFGDSDTKKLKAYDLVYSVDGGEPQTAVEGKMSLKVGQTVKISGIPVGTEYSISEIGYPNRYIQNGATNVTGTINEGVAINATINNGAANEVYDLILKKTIDDKYYNKDDKYSCNETYAKLTDVEQSFVFTIRQYDLPSNYESRKVINEFKEVITFNNSDKLSKQKVIKNLPKGYYEISEDTDWSWKYEFESVSANERGKSQYSYAKVEDIDLGYSIKKTPVVEFVNKIKYTDMNHDDVPEGDTAVEKNVLKK